MSQEGSATALFDWWTKQFGESPLIAPAIGAWSQAVAQAPGPEALEEWKRRLDESIAAWSAALEKAMATDAFAETLGKTLDRWLVQQGGARRQAEQAADALSAFGLPSRVQLTELASGQAEVEDRLAAVDERLDALARRLEDLFAVLAERARRAEHPATHGEGE